MKLYRFLYAIYMHLIDFYLVKVKYRNDYQGSEVAQINAKGWVPVSNLLTSTDIEGIAAIEKNLLEIVKANFDACKGRIYDFHKDHNIPEHINREMHRIAQIYFNDNKVILDQTQFQLSVADTAFTPLGKGWHVDDHRRILKFFLYTTPVNEQNGAMSYVEKSHLRRVRGKKFLWDWTKKLSHTYFDDVSEFPKESFLKLTGEKYSMFAVDTSGLHSANELIEGERIVMVFNFRETRYEPANIFG